MDTRAEGHVLVRPAFEIELLGRFVGCRIQVGGHQHCHDLFAPLQVNAAEIHVAAHIPRFRNLHWRDKAQELLDRKVNAAPVLFEPVAQGRIFRELED